MNVIKPKHYFVKVLTSIDHDRNKNKHVIFVASQRRSTVHTGVLKKLIIIGNS